MTEEPIATSKTDPTINVKNIVEEAVKRLDDVRAVEIKRIDEKIDLIDDKVQSQFTSAKEAVGIASTAQEKAMAAALDGTKEAINKADINTDKRFDGISQKIDAVIEQINKSSGAQGIYVTHSDLTVALDNLSSKFEIMLRPVITFMNTQTGKEGVTDPAIAELTKSVKDLVGTKSQGISSSWGVMLAVVGLISAILGIFAIISRFLP